MRFNVSLKGNNMTDKPSMGNIALVVPTTWTRPNELDACIDAINKTRETCPLDPYILGPAVEGVSIPNGWGSLLDAGNGLVVELNKALLALAETHEFVTWIGDDDLLISDGFSQLVRCAHSDSISGAFYGQVSYISPSNERLGVSKFGVFASATLAFGPNLVPQPGSLLRSTALKRVGGLDTSLQLAFDHKLFLDIKKDSGLTYVPHEVASFRWHPDSLTVRARKQSVSESLRAKRKARGYSLGLVDHFISMATLFAGRIVSNRVKDATNDNA